MCGIFFSICSGGSPGLSKDNIVFLQGRGPDSFAEHYLNINVPTAGASTQKLTLPATPYSLKFTSTVLALRGREIQVQPLVDKHTGSVLCWNGEAWKVDGKLVSGNDTQTIFKLLLAACASTSDDAGQAVARVLASVSGPFSFVFYNALSLQIYFGRDGFGRRSLLSSNPTQDALILSSVSPGIADSSSTEVDANGVHCIYLQRQSLDAELFPWPGTMVKINRALPFPHIGALSSASPSLLSLEHHLQESLRLRVADIPRLSRSVSGINDAKVAVLFSGGLDSTLLARLAHQILPQDEPIDLLNVAFENPRSVAANPNTSGTPYEYCPDRITGRSSYSELLRVCPDRLWRFIAIDVPFSETTIHRRTIIQLMEPHRTEMDMSIAMALYFAARGRGRTRATSPNDSSTTDANVSYATAARVLLSGFGADEIFAGYTRHATAFSRRGYEGLIDELDLDFQRIGQRNLGRDDRVMAHWGREVRYPFLDETFVTWALETEIWEKCGFRDSCYGAESLDELGQAINGKLTMTEEEEHDSLEPAKQLLRFLALKLGLSKVAKEKKRAIQFGARTAKMEIGKGKTKGTDMLMP